jgi:hypothetical protein
VLALNRLRFRLSRSPQGEREKLSSHSPCNLEFLISHKLRPRDRYRGTNYFVRPSNDHPQGRNVCRGPKCNVLGILVEIARGCCGEGVAMSLDAAIWDDKDSNRGTHLPVQRTPEVAQPKVTGLSPVQTIDAALAARGPFHVAPLLGA